jgi:hypothetical protein
LTDAATQALFCYNSSAKGITIMPAQTLTIGGRRFVVLPERNYLDLQQKARKTALKKSASREVLPEFAADAMRESRTYRKSRKAAKWTDVRAKLGQ